MPCRIELSELELSLAIGCTQSERAAPQPIRISAVIRSPEHFPACGTDALKDTLDAAAIQELLFETASRARVQTLERLGQLLETAFRERFSARRCEWELKISKPRFGWSYVHAWSS